MASPFLRRGVHNLRFLWTPLGTVADLRGGVPKAGTPVAIDLYAERSSRQEQDVPMIRAGSLILAGYICRWVELPEDGALTDAGTDWGWDDSGLMPSGLLPGATGRAFWGSLAALPTTTGGLQGEARVLELGGPYGTGGIGARVRQRAGDEITLALTFAV